MSSSAAPAAWFEAARAGDSAALVQQLASSSQLLDAQEAGTGQTALALSCAGGHSSCVRELLRRRASLDLLDATGRTCLMLACENGRADIVRILFKHAAPPSEEEDDVTDAVDDVELNLNLQDAAGDTALLKAARVLALECVQLLLEYTEQRVDAESVNDAGETALLAATATAAAAPDEDALAVISYLLPRTKVNRMNKSTGATPLFLALITASTSDDSFELVRLISTASGVDVNQPDARGETPLMHCIADDRPLAYLQHFLTTCKASQLVQNQRGYTALHLAVRDSNIAAVQALLTASPPIELASVLDNEFGWTPLQHAAAKNESEMIKLWGEASSKLPVTSKDKRGSTALHLAARFGHLTCVKYLVKFGARLDETDLSGSTPLVDAAVAGRTEVVRWLREKGARVVDVRDRRENNVLHKIVEKETMHASAMEMAKLLLEGGSGTDAASELLNSINTDGETPWMVLHRVHGTSSPFFAYFSEVAKRLTPIAPVITQAQASGDGAIVVTFTPPANHKFMVLEHKYEVRATPVTDEADGVTSESDEVRLVKKKPTGSAGSKKKPTLSAAAAADASASSTPIKLAKPASIKKSTASGAKKSSASSVTAITSGPAATRPLVTATPTAQTALGTSSPLRISNLLNGTSYALTVVSINSAGVRSADSQPFATRILVGTPAAPTITQITSGATWLSVAFMPPAGAAAAVGTKDQIVEFVLTATVVTANPRHSAPPMASPSAASSEGVNSSMHRVVSATASPALLTNLAPGLTYAVALRARNAYGLGATTPTKTLTLTEAPPPTPSAIGHLISLNAELDASELAEASSLLHSSLASDLTALVRAHRKQTGDDSVGLHIRTVKRVENNALRQAYENAPSFMQSLGCPRAESLREAYGLVCVTPMQAVGIAKHGLLPFAHPLSHGYTPNALEQSYSQGLYPVGSPFRAGVYIATTLTRRMLLAAAATATASPAATTKTHHVLVCKFLPGRSVAPEVTATSSVPQPTALCDSYRSASGTQVCLFSSAQVLPLYAIEFDLALELVASDTVVLSEAEAALLADAETQITDTYNTFDASPSPSAITPARGFGVSKWMGSAPSSSILPPGELPAGSEREVAAPAVGAAQRRSAAADEDDDSEYNERADRPRQNIIKAQSALLGPVTAPQPQASASASGTAKKKPAPAPTSDTRTASRKK